MKSKIVACVMAGTLLAGCTSTRCIITSSQSVLGVSVAQNQATQLYEAKAGIVVNQIAVVPCNTNNGFVPDVVEEFRVNNLFVGGLTYQRLAVGSNAVSQPGAAVMFAKDSSGNLVLTNLPDVIGKMQLKQK